MAYSMTTREATLVADAIDAWDQADGRVIVALDTKIRNGNLDRAAEQAFRTRRSRLVSQYRAACAMIYNAATRQDWSDGSDLLLSAVQGATDLAIEIQTYRPPADSTRPGNAPAAGGPVVDDGFAPRLLVAGLGVVALLWVWR